MDSFTLEPTYSTNQISGKCIKCLAEREANSCIRELLRVEGMDSNLEQKYEMLVAFLQSLELQKLRYESEKYLAEGKKVTLKLSLIDGKPEYQLEIG